MVICFLFTLKTGLIRNALFRVTLQRDNAISQLPTIRVSQELLNGTPSCVVCLEAYALDEELRQLPCEHGFHDDCIERWLKQVRAVQ